MKPETFASLMSAILYEKRFGPYFCQPVIVGLGEDDKPFICTMDSIGAKFPLEIKFTSALFCFPNDALPTSYSSSSSPAPSFPLGMKMKSVKRLRIQSTNSRQIKVCLTVGAYSKWIDGAPSGLTFLLSIIGILVSGMSMCMNRK